MSGSVFISRQLDEFSPILEIANAHNLLVEDRSLISFEEIAFDLPGTPWLFFYSKTGVQYFFESIRSTGSQPAYKVACFGPATAAFCAEFYNVSFISNANPEDCARDLVNIIDQQSISFICGKNSLRSVQKQLKTNMYEEVIVYDHNPLTNLSLKQYDIAILTSPMNVSSFFANEGAADKYIAIGNTTADSLTKHGIDPVISPRPTEKSLAIILGTMVTN